MPRSPTGETPFSLACGTETVIPIEIGVHSFRVQHHNPTTNEEGICINLDLVEKERETTILRNTKYKRHMTRYYNSRVKPQSFLPRDLVLKKVILSTKDSQEGKLGPN